MEHPQSETLTYKSAGVDIDAGNRLVQLIKPIARRTHRPGVIGGLGGFGALFELPLSRYREPVLVSGTDGVGTKLKLAIDLGKHDSIGIDLVAMCVNDLIVQGAEPLFFLDYFATGRLDVDIAEQVIAGIGRGCELAGAALVGGETAEMPGLYATGDYDLAGFCVGIVEKSELLDGSRVREGDALIGVASTGPHSNGYSLIRRIIETSGADLNQRMGDATLGERLLCPTRIYVKPLLQLLRRVTIHALAHITGGGLTENVPRVLPAGLAARFDRSAWPEQEVFGWLQRRGNITDAEMLRTFNCGIGMVVCVGADQVPATLEHLHECGETAWLIGNVVQAESESERVVYR